MFLKQVAFLAIGVKLSLASPKPGQENWDLHTYCVSNSYICGTDDYDVSDTYWDAFVLCNAHVAFFDMCKGGSKHYRENICEAWEPEWRDLKTCQSGCACKKGFYWDEHTEECISWDDCLDSWKFIKNASWVPCKEWDNEENCWTPEGEFTTYRAENYCMDNGEGLQLMLTCDKGYVRNSEYLCVKRSECKSSELTCHSSFSFCDKTHTPYVEPTTTTKPTTTTIPTDENGCPIPTPCPEIPLTNENPTEPEEEESNDDDVVVDPPITPTDPEEESNDDDVVVDPPITTVVVPKMGCELFTSTYEGASEKLCKKIKMRGTKFCQLDNSGNCEDKFKYKQCSDATEKKQCKEASAQMAFALESHGCRWSKWQNGCIETVTFKSCEEADGKDQCKMAKSHLSSPLVDYNGECKWVDEECKTIGADLTRTAKRNSFIEYVKRKAVEDSREPKRNYPKKPSKGAQD